MTNRRQRALVHFTINTISMMSSSQLVFSIFYLNVCRQFIFFTIPNSISYRSERMRRCVKLHSFASCQSHVHCCQVIIWDFTSQLVRKCATSQMFSLHIYYVQKCLRFICSMHNCRKISTQSNICASIRTKLIRTLSLLMIYRECWYYSIVLQ